MFHITERLVWIFITRSLFENEVYLRRQINDSVNTEMSLCALDGEICSSQL